MSHTTLESEPDAPSSVAARIYSNLTTTFVNALVASHASPLLPSGVVVNVNYPAIDNCPAAEDFKWVFAGVFTDPFGKDVETCGRTTLPSESTVVETSGCYVSVAVLSASTKLGVGSALQGEVLDRLSALSWGCLPN